MAEPVYGYDKNTDYMKLMEEAAKNGDMARAAIYEAQRNEKIAGEGLTQYQPTSQYASYLPGSGSAQGSQQQTNVGGTQGGSAYGFQNPYLEDLNAAIGRLQDTSAYKKAYLREAERTMGDVLGQYSTMTGGIPSTQAVAAASQQADYYKSQLGEKLADLDRENASLLLSAGQQAQSEYQMMISEALDRWTKLGYADDRVAQILGVRVGTPTSDQSYLTWQQGQQDKSDAYTMAMTLLQAGQMPGADTLAAAGITAEDAQKLYTAFTTPTYSGGGGGRGSGSGSAGKVVPMEERKKLAAMYESGGDDAIASTIAAYKAQGYDYNELWNWIHEYYTYKAPTPGYATGAATGAATGTIGYIAAHNV